MMSLEMQELWNRLRRMRWLPALLLALAVLLPYQQMLVGRVIPIPDDIFVSDLMDGEFPARVEAARLVCAGESPVWTSRIFTGHPLSVDPLSIALFSALPPALALGWLIGLFLVAASVGTYCLARQLGASRTGGILAGFGYAWSGFFVCQLRHLGVLGVVAWFPLALYFLEMAATGGALDRRGAREVPARRRLAWLTGFAAVFGMQCLAGFPQSVYISALVYAALVASRIGWLLVPDERKLKWSDRMAPVNVLALGALGAVMLGALVGMVALLPLRELGTLSDRGTARTFEWATQANYWLCDILTFFVPYANGDIADGTYKGTGIFWEDYGYVGLATVLLAILVVVMRARRFAVAFWALAALVAYVMVLGRETPLYRLAFQLMPGLDTFRFPTRFLFVVELALAILGGLGLTLVEEFITRKLAFKGVGKRVSMLVGVLVVALTGADLVYQNYRQNPFVNAAGWLAAPRAAAIIRADGKDGRVYTPGSPMLHIGAFKVAKGWSGDLAPYYAQREFLQPNSNLLHHLATVNGYVGISPRWTVDLLGDHNRRGIIDGLYEIDADGFRASPVFYNWLEALAVRWIALPTQVASDRLEHVGTAPPAEVYRLPGAMPRARVVTQGRVIASTGELLPLLLSGKIDPRREVVLHDPGAADVVASLPGDAADGNSSGDARIVVDRSTEVVVEAIAPRGGLLFLADTFYPGWEATVDGRPAAILRANVAHRAVELPPGSHRIVFQFHSRSATSGLILTGVGILSLLIAAAFILRRLRTGPRNGWPATEMSIMNAPSLSQPDSNKQTGISEIHKTTPPMSETPASSHCGNWHRHAFAALLVLVVLVAVPGLRAGLFTDDYDEIEWVGKFSGWKDVWNFDCYGYFRPVKNAIFYLMQAQPGEATLTQHIFGLLCYFWGVAGVYLLTRSLLGHRWFALACVALWALAPTQVSTMLWLSATNISLSVGFLCVALYFHDKARGAGIGDEQLIWRWFICAVLFGFVAQISYETAVVLAPLAVVLDWCRGRRVFSRQGLAAAGVLGLATIGYLVLRNQHGCRLSLHGGGNGGFEPDIAAWKVAVSAPWFFWQHLSMWLLPVGNIQISSSYLWMKSAGPLALGAAWIGWLALVVLPFFLRRRFPMAAFGIVWFLVASFPTGNFIPIQAGPVTDYYTVIPSIGLALALADFVRALLPSLRSKDRNARITSTFGVALILVPRILLIPFTCVWASVWSNPIELWLRVIDSGPYQFQACGHAAHELLGRGRIAEARDLAGQATRVAPWNSTSWLNLAEGYFVENNMQKALACYEKLAGIPRLKVNNRMFAELRLGMIKGLDPATRDAAMQHYRTILVESSSKYHASAAYELAILYNANHDRDKALATLQRALTINPRHMGLIGVLQDMQSGGDLPPPDAFLHKSHEPGELPLPFNH